MNPPIGGSPGGLGGHGEHICTVSSKQMSPHR